MCGIFGFVATPQSAFDERRLKPLLDQLFRLSETRGKDASGVCLFGDEQLTVLKRPQRAQSLIRTSYYNNQIERLLNNRALHAQRELPVGFIGHARMVTNGSEERHPNNQPVIKDHYIGLLNGIVVNDAALWNAYPHLQRQYEVDTEVILSLLHHFRNEENLPPTEAFRQTFNLLEGGNSVAVLSDHDDGLLLATSNGSLYYALSRTQQAIIFASEKYILSQAIEHQSVASIFTDASIVQLHPGKGMSVAFHAPLKTTIFDFDSPIVPATECLPPSENLAEIIDIVDVHQKKRAPFNNAPLTKTEIGDNDRFTRRVNEAVGQLKRCTRCLLPESFPFIHYDTQGVCNYCHNYVPMQPKGREDLEKLVEPYRRRDDEPTCLVPLSGGRDSSFGIHYVTQELGLRPIAYTYDWGMVTDLARRNISRLCGRLGVEHILISADIKTKRRNISKNIRAWLKRPRLGTVPLFMAGDKQFFYYANMLKKQMDLGIVLFNMNPLERTDFKVGFAGIDENYSKEKHYNLSTWNKARMAFYYGKEYMLNPAYLNSTLFDTAFAFFSYYLIPKDYYTLYDYLRWDESVVEDILIPEYDWEIAEDTTTTWRIGDGTAAFYNYIYYTMAGFSENDTLRSNQIREGMIDRDEALEKVYEENQPRYDSLQWYCDTVQVDLRTALDKINSAPKLYPLD